MMFVKALLAVLIPSLPAALLAAISSESVGDWMLETAKQVPALAVLAVVVYLFLDHIQAKEKRDIDRETRIESARLQMLERMGESCHRVQERAIQTIDRNSEVLEAHREQSVRLEVALSKGS